MDEKIINDYQKDYYNKADGSTVLNIFIDDFQEYILDGDNEEKVKILDIGCGNCKLLNELIGLFGDKAEYVGIDTVYYDNWTDLDPRIKVSLTSAFDIGKVFMPKEFDIVICSAVIHHLIVSGYKRTIKKQMDFMDNVKTILKPRGLFLVSEYSLESFIGNSSSYIHFFLTNIKNPFIARLLRFIGAKSAGVGTFFRSTAKLKEFFEDRGFVIEKEYPPISIYRFKGLKAKMASIILLCKEHRREMGFVLKKANTE